MLDLKALLSKILDALKVDYIIEEGASGNGYYRKWNSGILEQWGQVTTSASSGNVSVGITFPVAFVDTNYYLQAMPSRNFGLGQSLAENYYVNGNRQATTTKTTVSWYKSGNAYATEIRYFVIGKWGGVIESIKRFFTSLSSPKDWGWAMC